MKRFTFTLLMTTIFLAIAGFSSYEYTGITFVRFAFLISFIGLFISCLDAVILSRRKRRKVIQSEKELKVKPSKVKVNQ
ncbi:hypothetical protein [Altibacter sp. HG106]|uniref:hypothetical protein n=1 Tax=Altibacter sp. HG106 TaxID=3023937 RepID=UPI002350876F|nr:hypothetical protein [Altibacter sp. HG106]MDC7995786.1 hypothetical protein [Altibacter sp. HG106]